MRKPVCRFSSPCEPEALFYGETSKKEQKSPLFSTYREPPNTRYFPGMAEKVTLTEAQIQECVKAAKAGDTDAFGQLYDHFFQSVYRYCAFRMPTNDAEDATADIFVKAWEKLHTYSAYWGTPFGAWLFRIARHTVIDALRREQPMADEVPEEHEDQDRFNKPESAVRQQFVLKTVRKAFSELPRDYRDVLHLSTIAGLQTSEIARVLRRREGAIRVLKLRALQKLRSMLPKETDDRV